MTDLARSSPPRALAELLPDLDCGETAPPVHVQIAEHLRAAIADGRFRVGSQLPKLYRLVHRYGVSERTVHAALNILEHSDLLIAGRHRDGAVVVRRFPFEHPSTNRGQRSPSRRRNPRSTVDTRPCPEIV